MTRLTWDEYEKLSDEKKIDAIMKAMTHYWGGETYEIRWDHVIHAEINDDHHPRLTIQPIKEWIEENEQYVTEYLTDE